METINGKSAWSNAKVYCHSHGTSLKEIASKAGISYPTVTTQSSRGVLPDIGEAFALSQAIGCSIEELFFGKTCTCLANEDYESQLLAKVREEDPRLFKFIISEFGYSGLMNISKDEQEEIPQALNSRRGTND